MDLLCTSSPPYLKSSFDHELSLVIINLVNYEARDVTEQLTESSMEASPIP
jgi:hypothetical protein